MSTELFITPPHPLAQLPVLIPPPSPLPINFTTKDFLLTFPPHAATVMRSHRHHISSHQRNFHCRRLLRSAAAFLPVGCELSEAEVARRVDDVCDGLLTTLKLSTQHELILTIIAVNVPPTSTTATTTTTTAATTATTTAAPSGATTCFVAHGRFTSPFPASVPLVTCLLHPTAERYLATLKHSQWIRDRAPLESLKQSYECGELIMCEEGNSGSGGGGGSEVREGLITNVMVEVSGVLRGCRHTGRLLGYFESLLLDGSSGGGAEGAVVTVDGLRGGRYESVFITGTSVCIAAVSGVKWLVDGSGSGSSGALCGQQQCSEASIRRVEAIRQRMLATLDRHIAEDKQRKQAIDGV